MQYLDEPLGEAAQHVVDDLFKDGGMGGIIAVDRQGNGKRSCTLSNTLETDHFAGPVALPLNCDGMYRGVIRPDGVPLTAIFFDDELSQL